MPVLGVHRGRYLDDYEFVFPSLANAEGALGPLQEVLGLYELALNAAKTMVGPLPQVSEEQWIPGLREFRIRSKPALQRQDLIRYFDLAFELARRFSSKTVLNYAVAGLRSVALDTSNVSLAQDLVLQSAVNEAGVARFACEMLIRWQAAGLGLDYEKIRSAIDTMVRHHAPLMQGSEVAWALWAAIAFEVQLDDDAVLAAVRMEDSIVALLCLDAAQRGHTDVKVSDSLVAQIGTESFGSERWLLLYEGVRHGWLPGTIVDNDAFKKLLDLLLNKDVVFYDSTAELNKIQRPLDELRGRTLPVVGFVFDY